MKHSLHTLLCALALLPFAGTGSAAEAGSSEFFRVSSSQAETVISGLSREGWLAWSNSSFPASYLIERSGSLSDADWAPLSRGWASNTLASVKILELQPPAGMRFIPGGNFTMGNILADPTQFAEPTNSVTLSPFYMDVYEATVVEVLEVMQWAYDEGVAIVSGNFVQDLKGTNLLAVNQWDSEITFATNKFSRRSGRGNFPVHYISWFGALSYCNWKSLREDREPCYSLDTWECDFTKQGYRLPTEAEWEYAARGGYHGKRFPWPHKDTITHSDANYRSATNNWYDVSPTRGYHPNWYGIGLRPGSSPVGSFAPNNFGLYDMCGNVWEWVWDWSANYSSAPKVNPIGPATGTFKVFRGGAWRTTAERNTCAVRYRAAGPGAVVNDVGFRTVISYPR